MIAGIEARARTIAEAARRQAAARLATRVRDAAPDVVVELDGDGVTVTGRRVLSDGRLTWIGSLLR